MKIQGKGVSKGIAIGTLHFVEQEIETVEKRTVPDPEAEVRRFESARALAAARLGELAVETARKLGEENSLLFEIHQMMLEDLDYRESVEGKIRSEGVCAEYAVQQTAVEFANSFAQMDDEYMQARAVDVEDVSRRVVELLLGKEPAQILPGEARVLAAKDFTPSETAAFEKETVLGLLTLGGSANSHTAIFARTMGIPAVIGLDGIADLASLDGRLVAFDGATGTVEVEPDEAALQEWQQQKAGFAATQEGLKELIGRPSATKSGKQVKLYANIGSVADAKAAVEGDAEGIGLFRSEFLYLESSDYPTEQAQYDAYRAVAEAMGDKPVIIRTLDIGADKQAAYFKLPGEENPALGMRALRICLTRPEVFQTQLRAIYRASVHGNLSIMFPMVASLWEIKAAKDAAEAARQSLAAEGVPFQEVPLGIMVETPAAALLTDEFAPYVDFFSIGTNDLTQYTLAVDRQNQSLDAFCDTHHPAVLKLIETTVQNAHKHGIWAGICGELAADESLLSTFLAMGVDELSMTPTAILSHRKAVREMP